MKLATKYAPCLRGQGDDVGMIIFEKINFFGRMTRQGIEPATSRTRVRYESPPLPIFLTAFVTVIFNRKEGVKHPPGGGVKHPLKFGVPLKLGMLTPQGVCAYLCIFPL